MTSPGSSVITALMAAICSAMPKIILRGVRVAVRVDRRPQPEIEVLRIRNLPVWSHSGPMGALWSIAFIPTQSHSSLAARGDGTPSGH